MSDDPLGKFCDYISKDDLLDKYANRIAEIEAALREVLDYIDDPYNDLAIHIGKILEKKDVYV
jgi:hypothetical protein